MNKKMVFGLLVLLNLLIVGLCAVCNDGGGSDSSDDLEIDSYYEYRYAWPDEGDVRQSPLSEGGIGPRQMSTT